MHNHSFATAKEVIAALKGIGIDGQLSAVVSISKHCRQRFLDLLSEAIVTSDDSARQRNVVAIRSLLSVATEESFDLLRSVLSPTPVDEPSVMRAASALPVRFASALSAAIEDNTERKELATNFLREAIEKARLIATPTQPVGQIESSGATEGYLERRRADPNSNKYRSVHAYGSTYALCFNSGTWHNEVGVMLDAAVYTGSRFDWNDSIHIWLSPMEVGEILAVFRRWKPRAEISSHGARNEKTFILEAQPKHFYGKVLVKSRIDSPARAVPITPKDATAISILLIEQLAAAYPNLPLQEVLATVSATHSVYDAANPGNLSAG